MTLQLPQEPPMTRRKQLKATQKAQDAHTKAKVGHDSLAELTVSAPPERLLKGDVVQQEETTKAGERRTRVDTQRVLDRYYHQWGHITKAQYDAGDRLFREWKAAGGNLNAAIGRYEPGGSAPSNQPKGPPASVMASEVLTRARRFVGPDHWAILVTVVLADTTAADWARAREYPEGSGMVTLKIALNRVAEFYRIQDGGRRRK